MPLSKPPDIESDAFKSAKWDEITAGRDFASSDAPALALLCQWRKVARQAMDELANLCDHATPPAAVRFLAHDSTAQSRDCKTPGSLRVEIFGQIAQRSDLRKRNNGISGTKT